MKVRRIYRKDKLEEEMEHLTALISNLEVPLIDEAYLQTQVYLHLQAHNPTKVRRFSFKVKGFRHAAVNYLRHRCTCYDTAVNILKRTKNEHKIQPLKDNVLNRIADVYPFLKEECVEQMFKL